MNTHRGFIMQPPFTPVIAGTTYEVFGLQFLFNEVTHQWILVAAAVAHVPGIQQPIAIDDYKTRMTLADAYLNQVRSALIDFSL